MKTFFGYRPFVGAFLLAMFMVSFDVSLWMSFFSGVALLWKWGVETHDWPKPSRKITGILSVLLLAGVLLQFRTLIGQDPSSTFLLGLAALKVLDYQTERDHKFLVLLGFVLIASKALFSLDIYWMIPMILSFVGLWMSLFPVFYRPKFRSFAWMFFLSMPLALFLFFVFPRFVIPWAMSQGASMGLVGFSDELTPGSVAQLTSNKQVVMRAKISREVLAKELYWRGSVLTYSRGLSWSPRHLSSVEVTPKALPQSHYEVALEPEGQRYLFVLDGTDSIGAEGANHLSMEGGIFRLTRARQKTFVYQGHIQEGSSSFDGDISRYLQIPSLGPAVDKWVEEIKIKFPRAEDRLKALEDFFSSEGFFYTLSPGIYKENSMQEFLFQRKKGFCEHYAGSYATLARALGWPSRVVVGYQGGRLNPWGDFWVVSQQDAHAWAEVLINGQWVRKDPTQWVAPLRFEIGAEDFFALSPENQLLYSKMPNWRRPKGAQDFYVEHLGSWLESLNYRWTHFLLEFDRSAQSDFLSRLRIIFSSLSLVATALGLLATSIVILVWRRQRIPLIERRFQYLEKWGARRGFPRAQSEPPLTYIARIKKACPDSPSWTQDLATEIDRSY